MAMTMVMVMVIVLNNGNMTEWSGGGGIHILTILLVWLQNEYSIWQALGMQKNADSFTVFGAIGEKTHHLPIHFSKLFHCSVPRMFPVENRIFVFDP